MKILGIVAEYNPFHNGHEYQLKLAKNKSNCDAVVIAMSGNFVQRGDVAIIDKWRRAEAAIYGGADLVVEIPLPNACQNAELFAKSAIELLKTVPIDILSFGCENDNIDVLFKIANLQINQYDNYIKDIKHFLNLGYSYPKSITNAINKSLGNYATNYINTPNNILALEYIKSIILSKQNIEVVPIIRKSSNYHDKDIKDSISSATSIRKSLLNKDFNNISKVLPKRSYDLLFEFYNKFNKFNTLDNFLYQVYYSIISSDKKTLIKIYDINEGLENKIIKNTLNYNSINDFIMSIKSKRYTYARIRRILLNILLDINYKTIEELNKIKYVRVLASNNTGNKVIRNMKNNNVNVITKTSDYRKYNIDIRKDNLFNLTNKTTNIFYLPFVNNSDLLNIEYKKSNNFIDI